MRICYFWHELCIEVVSTLIGRCEKFNGLNNLTGVSKVKNSLKFLCVLIATYLLSLGSALAEPALVISIDGCGVFDGTGAPVRYQGTGVTVSAQNANGNVTHTCTVDAVTPPPNGRAAVFSIDHPETFGRTCGMDDGTGGNIAETDDWHEVVTSKGKAKLVCQFHY